MSKQRGKRKIEKTQNLLDSKNHGDVIYEIYRACRLCGESSGYKLPIIQNIVPIEDTEVELKTKIQECLQIEVQENDKMPPLICELCADKINDFYYFLLMCRQRNKQIRMRLGLPIQVKRKEVIDQSDNILETPEPVSLTEKEIEKTKFNKEKQVKVIQQEVKKNLKEVKKKTEKLTGAQRELRDLMASNFAFSHETMPLRLKHSRTKQNTLIRSSTPPPPTKLANKNVMKSEKKENKKYLPSKPGPSSSKLKRQRESAQKEVQNKKVKIEQPARPKRNFEANGKVANVKLHDASDSDMQSCDICRVKFRKGISFLNHYRIHTRVRATIKSEDECSSGNRKLPDKELTGKVDEPKVVHKCEKCDKPFGVYKTFRKHQAACRRDKLKIPHLLRNRMKPVQVRMTRCDPLLELRDGHYDVSNVRNPYGLDRSCVYPYISISGLLCSDRMVEIKSPEIPDSFDINDDIEEFVHWDSDVESDEDQVKKLSTLSLKVIFSNKFLGKVPKKRKKVKSFYNDFSFDINSIIHNLDDTKIIFDNLKDNWSDNVSDSILKNGYDSDRSSLNEECNDSTYDKDKSNDKIDKINDDGMIDNEITVSSFGEKENPPKIVQNSNNENVSERTIEKTEMRHDNPTEDRHCESDRICEKSPSTSNNSLTDGENIETGYTTNNSKATSKDILEDKTSNENINMCSSFDKLNAFNSEIELLEIQILNDNNEDVCSNKKQSNAENLQNVLEMVNSSTSETEIGNLDTKKKSENQASETSENFIQSNENFPESEERNTNRCVNDKESFNCELSVSERNLRNVGVTMNDDNNTKVIDATNLTTFSSLSIEDKLNITNENENEISTYNKEYTPNSYLTNDSNPENMDPEKNSDIFNRQTFFSQSDNGDLETKKVKECGENIVDCNSIADNKDSVEDDLIEDNLLSNEKSDSVTNLKETYINQNQEYKSEKVKEYSEKIGEFDSIANKKNSIHDDFENLLNVGKTDGDGIGVINTDKISNGDLGIHLDDLEDISDGELDKEDSVNLNVTLDGVLPDRSTELDSISDGEFNFDEN